MPLSKVMPLIVLSGIGVHFGPAMQAKLLAFFNGEKAVICRYNMQIIYKAALYESLSGDKPDLSDFPAFIRRNIRTTKKGYDTSLDPWGTQYTYQINGKTLKIISAGPDEQAGTKDDIEIEGELEQLI